MARISHSIFIRLRTHVDLAFGRPGLGAHRVPSKADTAPLIMLMPELVIGYCQLISEYGDKQSADKLMGRP